MSEEVRIKCNKCGHLNLSHARSCAECGNNLDDQRASDWQKRYISSNDAKEIYESGKELYKLARYGESAKAFEKAIHSEPNNTEYKEWFAKALLKLEKYQEAIKITTSILGINPNLSVALWVRADARAALNDLKSAFADVSKSIELNPSDFEAIRTRKYIYYENQDWENGIADALRYHEIRGDVRLYSTGGLDPSEKMMYDTVNQHIKYNVYPVLKSNGERLVDYWFAVAEWGSQTRPKVYETHVSYHAYSTIGEGYLCLSDQNLRIVTLSKLSRQLEDMTRGNAGTFVIDILKGATGSVVEHKDISKEDQLWTVPNQTILGAQISGEQVVIATAVMNWRVYVPDPALVSAALNMALTGKLAKIGSTTKSNQESKSSEETIKLLKQLGELLEQGILTQAEFDQKKKELLGSYARLGKPRP